MQQDEDASQVFLLVAGFEIFIKSNKHQYGLIHFNSVKKRMDQISNKKKPRIIQGFSI